MIDKKEFLNLSKEVKGDSQNISLKNLKFFISFLKERGFKQVIKVYPDTDEPIVTFKFFKNKRPELHLSDVVTLTGPSFVPFNKDFVSDMCDLINALTNTINDTGICANVENDSINGISSYQFWFDYDYPEEPSEKDDAD